MPNSTLRSTVLPGAGLAVAGAVIVLLSPVLDLKLEAALLGAAVGATAALVPDRGALVRLAGIAAGTAVAWLGYGVRAQYLPFSTLSHALAVVGVLLACTALVAATGSRVPLWSVVLGAGAFAGAFELTYTGAPQLLVSNSIPTLTSLLISVAAGFAAAIVVDTRSSVPHTPSVLGDERASRAPESLPHQHNDFQLITTRFPDNPAHLEKTR